jgi:hypothetical protein
MRRALTVFLLIAFALPASAQSVLFYGSNKAQGSITPASPTFVQGNGGDNCAGFTVTAHTCQFIGGVTVGNLISGAIGWYSTSATLLTVVDNCGPAGASNTYSIVNNPTTGGGGRFAMFSAKVGATTNPCTVTATLSTGQTASMAVLEHTGQNASPVNTNTVNETTLGAMGGTASSASTTSTVSNTRAISFLFDMTVDDGTLTSPTGTIRVSEPANVCSRICAMDQAVAAASTFTTSVSYDGPFADVIVGVLVIKP